MTALPASITVLYILTTLTAPAQPQPVTWSTSVDEVAPDTITLCVDARISNGWHLYSQYLGEGGPLPTQFIFRKNPAYELVDSTMELGNGDTFFDNTYDMKITWYDSHVTFKQKIKIITRRTTVVGSVHYMTCNNEICTPGKFDFTIPLRDLE